MWRVFIIVPAVALALTKRCGREWDEDYYICKPFYQCDSPRKDPYSLDNRFGSDCDSGSDVCCKVSPKERQDILSVGKDEISTTKSTNTKPCGIRKRGPIDSKISRNENVADFAEFPWMVEILKANHSLESNKPLAISGGVLIAPNAILTTARALRNYKPSEIKIRAGEWDSQTTTEKLPHQERYVVKFIIHNNYNKRTLYCDLAILILSEPFQDADNIATICLPPQDFTFESENCIATGWDKNIFGNNGVNSLVLRKQAIAIVPHSNCQTQLRQTSLGNRFKLHDTFVCAKEVVKKYACTSEVLVCPDPSNPDRYFQAGVVAWRLGCMPEPYVYVNVAKYRNWIDDEMKKHSIDTTTYTN